MIHFSILLQKLPTVEATVNQIKALERVGADIVR
ncbi:hypothetical protein O5824_27885, partial [Escherichia coli]|nr:hypothetical protein [Escherichia coli]